MPHEFLYYTAEDFGFDVAVAIASFQDKKEKDAKGKSDNGEDQTDRLLRALQQG